MSRRSMLWSCAWTRKARFRRSTARNRFCHAPGQVERHTPEYQRMERRHFLLRWTWRREMGCQCFRRHRTAESENSSTMSIPKSRGLEVHLIMDNYCTHKAAPIKRWLLRHLDISCTLLPRIVLDQPDRTLVCTVERAPNQTEFSS